jgi:Flp pilus assembly protein TadG
MRLSPARGAAATRFFSRAGQRGQALVETALVIVFLVTLTMGIIEFGRAWMVANMITQAAREGARAGAVAPGASRDAAGLLLGGETSAIETLVLSEISAVMDTSTVSVNVTQPSSGGIRLVTVTVTGTVPLIFDLVGTSFSVNRSVSFRDEWGGG